MCLHQRDPNGHFNEFFCFACASFLFKNKMFCRRFFAVLTIFDAIDEMIKVFNLDAFEIVSWSIYFVFGWFYALVVPAARLWSPPLMTAAKITFQQNPNHTDRQRATKIKKENNKKMISTMVENSIPPQICIIILRKCFDLPAPTFALPMVRIYSSHCHFLFLFLLFCSVVAFCQPINNFQPQSQSYKTQIDSLDFQAISNTQYVVNFSYYYYCVGFFLSLTLFRWWI